MMKVNNPYEEVTIITNLSNHIPMLTTMDKTKETQYSLNFLNHINCGDKHYKTSSLNTPTNKAP
jgi:hypothetical protein